MKVAGDYVWSCVEWELCIQKWQLNCVEWLWTAMILIQWIYTPAWKIAFSFCLTMNVEMWQYAQVLLKQKSCLFFK